MKKYERLYEFIPFFENVSEKEVIRWSGSKKDAAGTLTLSYPIYDQQVLDFIKICSGADLLDHHYLETIKLYGASMEEGQEDTIRCADQRLVAAILTYYVRQERFCDGLWAIAIKNKVFLHLLNRLLELENKDN